MDLSYIINKLKINESQFYPDGEVLFEDDFVDGLQGWTWLMDTFNPVNGPVWSSRRTMRGTGSMLLETGDVLRMDGSGAGTATAIKRLTLPMKEDGSFVPMIESEYFFGYSSDNKDNPSVIQFGLDTQNPTRTAYRSYYKVRLEIWDEINGVRTCKWKVNTPNGFVDVPNATGFTYWNEAKSGFFRIRFRVNIITGYYDKMWINGHEFDLSSFECSHDGYVSGSGGGYDYGMNFSIDLMNRLNTSDPKWSKLYIPYVRGAVSV